MVLGVGLLGMTAFATVAPLQLWVLGKAGDAGRHLASSLNIGAFNLGQCAGRLARQAGDRPWRQPGAVFHWEGLHSAWLAAGDRTADAALDDAAELPVRLFVSGIQVRRADAAGAVVALGDSITDGAASIPGSNRRWSGPVGRAAGRHSRRTMRRSPHRS